MAETIWGKRVGTATALGGATSAGLYLASYGGGDSFRLHSTVLSLCLRRSGCTQHLPLWLDVNEVRAAAQKAYAQVVAVPQEQRVAQMPAAPSWDFNWTSQLLVCTLDRGSTDVQGGDTTFNLMAQGWLFVEELTGQQGISRWPLVGVFHAVGFTSSTPDDDPANAGFGGALAATDQHAHLVVEQLELDGHVVELSDWHVGGDTGRVAVGSAGGCGIVALVDLDRGRALECLLIVAPTASAGVLAALAPGNDEELAVEQVLAVLKALIPEVPGVTALDLPAQGA